MISIFSFVRRSSRGFTTRSVGGSSPDAAPFELPLRPCDPFVDAGTAAFEPRLTDPRSESGSSSGIAINFLARSVMLDL